MKKIFLASASPRRKELLKKHGIDFEIVIPEIEEAIDDFSSTEDYVLKISQKKAKAAAQMIKETDTIIIAADTIVVYNGIIFGKPKNKEDSEKTLKALSGKWHEVITGVTVAFINGTEIRFKQAVCITKVKFKNLDEQEIRAYIDSGEPADKAGSYAIQGKGADFVERIDGDYENVVGLPVRLVLDMINN